MTLGTKRINNLEYIRQFAHNSDMSGEVDNTPAKGDWSCGERGQQ